MVVLSLLDNTLTAPSTPTNVSVNLLPVQSKGSQNVGGQKTSSLGLEGPPRSPIRKRSSELSKPPSVDEPQVHVYNCHFAQCSLLSRDRSFFQVTYRAISNQFRPIFGSFWGILVLYQTILSKLIGIRAKNFEAICPKFKATWPVTWSLDTLWFAGVIVLNVIGTWFCIVLYSAWMYSMVRGQFSGLKRFIFSLHLQPPQNLPRKLPSMVNYQWRQALEVAIGALQLFLQPLPLQLVTISTIWTLIRIVEMGMICLWLAKPPFLSLVLIMPRFRDHLLTQGTNGTPWILKWGQN